MSHSFKVVGAHEHVTSRAFRASTKVESTVLGIRQLLSQKTTQL